MIFHESDKLENLRAGDTLVLSDGTKHEAVDANEDCDECSIHDRINCSGIHCDPCFTFKEIE